MQKKKETILVRRRIAMEISKTELEDTSGVTICTKEAVVKLEKAG